MKCPAGATEGRAESPINCNMYNWKYPQGNVLKLGDTHTKENDSAQNRLKMDRNVRIGPERKVSSFCPIYSPFPHLCYPALWNAVLSSQHCTLSTVVK